MSHGNARMTVHARLLIVSRHQAGWPQAHIAKAMGISRNCVRKWLDRYQQEGEAGLSDRSSRPHSSPRRTSTEAERRIIEMRSQSRRGPDWIAAELGIAPRTVSRVLARNGVPRLSTLDPLTGELIRTSWGEVGPRGRELVTAPPARQSAPWPGSGQARQHALWAADLSGPGPDRC